MLLFLGNFAPTYTIIVYASTFPLIIAIILCLSLGFYFVENSSEGCQVCLQSSLLLFLWWRLVIELCSPAEFFKTSSDTLPMDACLCVPPLLFVSLILLLFSWSLPAGSCCWQEHPYIQVNVSRLLVPLYSVLCFSDPQSCLASGYSLTLYLDSVPWEDFHLLSGFPPGFSSMDIPWCQVGAFMDYPGFFCFCIRCI